MLSVIAAFHDDALFDINYANRMGSTVQYSTALICASKRGHEKIVKELLQMPGIDIKREDVMGNTALTHSRYNTIAELLESVCWCDNC